MFIYKKVVLVAAIEVPDNLTEEKLEEVDSEFETSISLDLDNMQEGGRSDYLYEYGIYEEYDEPDGEYETSKLIRELNGRDSVLG